MLVIVGTQVHLVAALLLHGHGKLSPKGHSYTSDASVSAWPPGMGVMVSCTTCTPLNKPKSDPAEASFCTLKSGRRSVSCLQNPAYINVPPPLSLPFSFSPVPHTPLHVFPFPTTTLAQHRPLLLLFQESQHLNQHNQSRWLPRSLPRMRSSK